MGRLNSGAKTIVFCCNSLWGLVNFRGRVIQALVQDGHRVVLVARADVPVDQAKSLGAEFIAWNVAPRSTNPFRELGALWSLVKIYRQVQPDIGFQFTVKPVMYGAVVSWMTGVRCVSVITGLGYLFLGAHWKTSLTKWLYRKAFSNSHQVWFLNGDDHGMFASAGILGGLDVQILPGEGIDVAHFAGSPIPPSIDEFRFLMVARLVKDKGVVEYAEAARRVKSSDPRAKFQLLGPPYLAEDMSVPMGSVKAWHAEGVIEYLGAADDVRTAVAQAHCIVLPSYREGMPRVLMEAGAMGRPAVTTDVTGCRDVVRAGETGLLCQPRDAESLADACVQMLSLPRVELERMADEAHRTTLARFDDRIVISIYREVLDKLQ